MHRRRDEGCRREEAIRNLLKRHGDKRLTIGDVEGVALELGVSRPTMYRLVIAYRAKGTVSSVEPRTRGRRKDSFVLDRKREKLIALAIQEIPVMIKFSQRSKPPTRMRQNRLRRLSAPQELFVENLVTNGAAHILELAGDEIGYVITNSGDQIVEFHIEGSELSYAGQALDTLVQMFGVRSIFAQSFDPLLMFLGLACGSPAVTHALLYRVIADPCFESRSDITACPNQARQSP